MAVPTGAAPFHSLLSAAAALALLATAETEEPHADLHRAIVTGLPHYDPAIREKALAEQAKRSEERTPAAVASINPSDPAPV